MRAVAPLTIAALSLIAVASVALSGGSDAGAQSSVTIGVGDVWFCGPSFQDGVCETTVTAGGPVEWQWVGSAPHTTTHCADDFTNCRGPREWDSSPETTSGTFSHTFGPEDAGKTFLYRCQIHPVQMRGRITVVAPRAPTPTPTPFPQPSPQASPQPSPQASPQPSPEAFVQPTPQPSPQPSPRVALQPSPVPRPQSVMSTPVEVQPAVVPAGGGEPPPAGGGSEMWWLAVAGGAFLVASASLLAVRAYRR